MRANAGGIFLRYPFTPFRSCRGEGISRNYTRDFLSHLELETRPALRARDGKSQRTQGLG